MLDYAEKFIALQTSFNAIAGLRQATRRAIERRPGRRIRMSACRTATPCFGEVSILIFSQGRDVPALIPSRVGLDVFDTPMVATFTSPDSILAACG